VPMILAGDEMGRSQMGNNNAYCQDNEINWLNWNLLENNQGIYRFFQLLIKFRKGHDLLRHNSFVLKDGYGVSFDWHGFKLAKVDWSDQSKSLGMHIYGHTPSGPGDDIFLIANADDTGHLFELPRIVPKQWQRFIDTSYEWEESITEMDAMRPLRNQEKYLVKERSVVVLIAKN